MDLLNWVLIPSLMGISYRCIIYYGPIQLNSDFKNLFFFLAQIYLIFSYNLLNYASFIFLFTVFSLIWIFSFNFEKKLNKYLFLPLICYCLIWFLNKYTRDLADYLKLFQMIDVFFSNNMNTIVFTGLSYVGFKLIHFLIYMRLNPNKKISYLSFLSWLLFYPTLMMGPIHKIDLWTDHNTNEKGDFLGEIFRGIYRVAIGLFKVLFVTKFLSSMSIVHLTDYHLLVAPIEIIFIGIFIYTINLYINFSGYSDIAIGLGFFWGQKLPENFDNPFFKRNLQDFWKCWHMSLINWLREYVFTPVSISVARKFKVSKSFPLLAPSAGLLMTFITAGFWHKLNIGYLIWGTSNAFALIFLLIIQKNLGWKKKSFLEMVEEKSSRLFL